MAQNQEFLEYCCEQLERIAENISYKSMFGGHGIYCDGQIFALIADSELFFKGHKYINNFYEAKDSSQFTYYKHDKPYAMNYWLVPETVLEDVDELQEWLNIALKAGQAK